MSPFQRFLAELRRRHVPQTVAVYAVAAWAAIQFADVVVPNLGWPQGVVTAVIIAAGVGFPIVVALAWFLEWGPEGIHRTPDEAETEGAGAGAAGPAGAARPGRGRPVEPRSSYAPWMAAVGVLSVGIAAALVVVALSDGGDLGGPAGEAESDPRTRSERRQGARDAPVPPIPPGIASPEFADSLRRTATDSVMRALGEGGIEGLEGLDLGPIIEMATRIGESASRAAASGPVEIIEPEPWRFGAPHPAHAGDTITVQGIARAGQGVVAVEVDGRVVAESDDGAVELPFRARVPVGSAGAGGTRTVEVVVRVAGAEPLARAFTLAVVPRSPAGDSAADGGEADGAGPEPRP